MKRPEGIQLASLLTAAAALSAPGCGQGAPSAQATPVAQQAQINSVINELINYAPPMDGCFDRAPLGEWVSDLQSRLMLEAIASKNAYIVYDGADRFAYFDCDPASGFADCVTLLSPATAPSTGYMWTWTEPVPLGTVFFGFALDDEGISFYGAFPEPDGPAERRRFTIPWKAGDAPTSGNISIDDGEVIQP